MTRLDGWKDIASYLHRKVRTIQRWEHEAGLPIRRLGTGQSESVFAFASELDAWLASPQGLEATRAQGQESDFAAAPAAPAMPTRQRPAWRRWQVAGAALGILILVMAGAGFTWHRVARAHCTSPPTTWRMDGTTLVALDDGGTPCWTHSFDPQSPLDATVDARVEPIDLDGDLQQEFLVVPFVGSSAPSALYALDHNGSLLWSFRYAGSVSFGGRTFDGPWKVMRLFITDDPDDPSRRALWVISRDRASFPSVLVRLDPRSGKPVGDPFWHAGAINTVALYRAAAGPRLAVAVSSAGLGQPTLLVLDPDAIGGAQTGGDPEYRCTSCGSHAPLTTLVFPAPARFRGFAAPGEATEVVPGSGPAELKVLVDYVAGGRMAQPLRAWVSFDLDRDLHVVGFKVTGEYRQAYEALVHDHAIADVGPVPTDPSGEIPPPHPRRESGTGGASKIGR